ncbi:sensor domain-containing protein [Mycobacterium sp. M1]|uniref:Sensor domain-containing protein n=1 Tax=Mycolicibacter acidiphilus TaxID=2835306 RepID=A0ABS5RPF6_9MYCO|nr:sensor domain-containing protein [Mycolicibacter acidiphilus]MBS9536175.1 sensor domain-containing protein [Mycolicibacter acidiphilus]
MSLSEQPSAVKSPRTRLLIVGAVVAVVAVALVGWLVLPGKSRTAASGSVLTGDIVKQVLLDGGELTAMLDQPFKSAPGSLVYGGFDEMDNSSPPSDCVGVVDVAPQAVYQPSDVHSYVRETWAASEPGHADFQPLNTKVMFVKEAVVAMPTAADAQAVFAKFAERWKGCDGKAVNHEPITPGADSPPQLPGTEMHIQNVRITDSILSASIVLDKNPKAPDTRAVGIQGNCIIGVLIAFTGVPNATGSANPESSSTDAVQAMLTKVADLTKA